MNKQFILTLIGWVMIFASQAQSPTLIGSAGPHIGSVYSASDGIYVGTSDNILKSSDNGYSWASVPGSPSTPDVVPAPYDYFNLEGQSVIFTENGTLINEQRRHYIGIAQTLYFSNDRGASHRVNIGVIAQVRLHKKYWHLLLRLCKLVAVGVVAAHGPSVRQ